MTMIHPHQLTAVQLAHPVTPEEVRKMADGYGRIAADVLINAERERRSRERGAAARARNLSEKAARLTAISDELHRAAIAAEAVEA